MPRKGVVRDCLFLTSVYVETHGDCYFLFQSLGEGLFISYHFLPQFAPTCEWKFQSLRASIPVGDGAHKGGDKGLFISYDGIAAERDWLRV